ncbi:vacuole-localized protein 4-like isoform X1 [Asterias rubens]|uniref:vacuole-localized protein 4-like isoform X1 n=1 Tax=Asterias rubens TaxID=7604 RepID=UPI0014554DE6|nr:vacuole-localized protein 4-like isoform X1 [Asterias rubens]
MKGYTLLALLVVVGCVSAYQDDEVALLERLLDLKRSQNPNGQEGNFAEQKRYTCGPLFQCPAGQYCQDKDGTGYCFKNTQEREAAEEKRYTCGPLFQCPAGQYCQDKDGTGYCFKNTQEREAAEENEPTLRELLRNLESLLNKRTNGQEGNFAEQKRYTCGPLFQCPAGQYCQDKDGTGYCFKGK